MWGLVGNPDDRFSQKEAQIKEASKQNPLGAFLSGCTLFDGLSDQNQDYNYIHVCNNFWCVTIYCILMVNSFQKSEGRATQEEMSTHRRVSVGMDL